MCGINGFIDVGHGFSRDRLYNIVHTMNEQIIYRGPDEEGIYKEDNLCMGMRRLSIIDLKRGSQPIYNEDRTLVVVFNGEIYNFKTLKNELTSLGHIFKTESDTEIIVHAFEQYGTGSFNMLDGMYAFALRDIKNDKVYLVRDRMGEKPLYYAGTEEHFIFGSEMKSLISTGLIKKKISIRALNQYLQLTYIPAPLTIYEGVFKVRAGHYLEIYSNGEIKDCEYWDIPISSKCISYNNAVNDLRKLMVASVKDRMISDVPLGAFLSGGIDSASIVGLMKRANEAGVPQTFTMGSDYKGYDERERAREVVRMHKTEHRERVIDYDSFPKVMDVIIDHMDEPFADSSMIPTYILSKFVKENVTVALTGDAGDELFAGYNKYLIVHYGRIYQNFPRWFRGGIIKPFAERYGGRNRFMRKVKKTVDNADKEPRHRHKALMHMGIKEDEICNLLKESYVDKGSLDFIDLLYDKHPEATDLQKALYTDLKTVLEGDMLVKVDRMSMLNSLETRVPMLSKDIVEFAMSLPDEYKLNGRTRKRVLKDAMRPLLPKRFDRHPKKGFEIPVEKWLRHDMRKDVERIFSREAIEQQGIFNYDYINRIMREHFSKKTNRRDELWVLYVFEKWYEKEMVD